MSHYKLTAEAGEYKVTGGDAKLIYTRVINGAWWTGAAAAVLGLALLVLFVAIPTREGLGEPFWQIVLAVGTNALVGGSLLIGALVSIRCDRVK